MKQIFFAKLVVAALLLIAGCRRHDDVAYDETLERFCEVRNDLNAGGFGVGSLNEAGIIMNGWISCVSNASLRTKLSLELAKIILSVDLTNQPYRAAGAVVKRRFPRECITRDYPRYINAVCWIMKKNGCPPDFEMDFFLAALQKFRDSCFSVPIAFGTLSGESLELCSARTTAARHLYGEYDYVMSYIRRFVLPELSKYLPPELHDDFNRRIEPFFDYPSKEEFYEKMHPGSKYPLSAPKTTSNATAEAKTMPEVEVEVDFPENTMKEPNQ